MVGLHTCSSLGSPCSVMRITGEGADVHAGGKELGFGSIKIELYMKHWMDILDS